MILVTSLSPMISFPTFEFSFQFHMFSWKYIPISSYNCIFCLFISYFKAQRCQIRKSSNLQVLGPCRYLAIIKIKSLVRGSIASLLWLESPQRRRQVQKRKIVVTTYISFLWSKLKQYYSEIGQKEMCLFRLKSFHFSKCVWNYECKELVKTETL